MPVTSRRPGGRAASHRRFLVLAVPLAVVALGAMVGCSSDDAQPPAGPDVLAVGDSLTVGAQMGNLGKDDPAEWTVLAEQGRKTAEGIEVMKGADPGRFDEVVVALGTNDYRDTEAEFAAQVDQMMSIVGADTPVTWINVDTGTDTLAGTETGVNAALTTAAGRYPNLEIADWSTYVNSRPDVDDLRAGDGVHYNLDGYAVRARWMESLANS